MFPKQKNDIFIGHCITAVCLQWWKLHKYNPSCLKASNKWFEVYTKLHLKSYYQRFSYPFSTSSYQWHNAQQRTFLLHLFHYILTPFQRIWYFINRFFYKLCCYCTLIVILTTYLSALSARHTCLCLVVFSNISQTYCSSAGRAGRLISVAAVCLLKGWMVMKRSPFIKPL